MLGQAPEEQQRKETKTKTEKKCRRESSDREELKVRKKILKIAVNQSREETNKREQAEKTTEKVGTHKLCRKNKKYHQLANVFFPSPKDSGLYGHKQFKAIVDEDIHCEGRSLLPLEALRFMVPFVLVLL